MGDPADPATGTAFCRACQPNQEFPIGEILDHLRLLHPVQYGDGPAMWPDGNPVVVDTTLEPGDFTEAGDG